MKIAIINNETKHIEDLKKILKWNEVIVFSYNDSFNCDLFDLIILSWWSKFSIFNKNRPFKKEVSLILNSWKPIIWICLWAELIAKVFWAKISLFPRKIKWFINIFDINSWKKYLVYEAHRFYIKKLSKDLFPILRSNYWFEMFGHKNKKIFWLQFHPECFSWNDWKKIFFDILNDFGLIEKKWIEI